MFSGKIKQEWFPGWTPGMGDYGDVHNKCCYFQPSPLSIPDLAQRKEFENYFPVEIRISEGEKCSSIDI